MLVLIVHGPTLPAPFQRQLRAQARPSLGTTVTRVALVRNRSDVHALEGGRYDVVVEHDSFAYEGSLAEWDALVVHNLLREAK